jgi:hypothetical protein
MTSPDLDVPPHRPGPLCLPQQSLASIHGFERGFRPATNSQHLFDEAVVSKRSSSPVMTPVRQDGRSQHRRGLSGNHGRRMVAQRFQPGCGLLCRHWVLTTFG